jgi:hypothetical protein
MLTALPVATVLGAGSLVYKLWGGGQNAAPPPSVRFVAGPSGVRDSSPPRKSRFSARNFPFSESAYTLIRSTQDAGGQEPSSRSIKTSRLLAKPPHAVTSVHETTDQLRCVIRPRNRTTDGHFLPAIAGFTRLTVMPDAGTFEDDPTNRSSGQSCGSNGEEQMGDETLPSETVGRRRPQASVGVVLLDAQLRLVHYTDWEQGSARAGGRM